MSQSVPTTLGKYQIIREIARSNDIVYEGYDALMNRRVAIKELAIPSSANEQQKEDRIKRFQREVKAAGSVSHPGIVTIFEFGEENGRFFMAMEYLDGRTLRQELDTRGFVETDRAFEIAIEMLSALDYAHSHGVIHRDIKPENIQILSDGRIKVTDFGIARLSFEPNLTMDGQVFGTPSYMSPEQVVGKDIDARSDLFSVGSVLVEMLTGQKAFAGDSVVSITYAILNKEPAYPAHLSAYLIEFLQKALNKVPALRWSSAGEMMEGLKRVQRDMAAPAPPPVMAQPMVGGQTVYGMPPPPPAQTVYQYPGYQPPSQQPMIVPVPVYVRPPRPPLLKPETKAFLGRLFVITVSVGLVIAVIVVAAQLMLNAVSQQRRGSTSPVPVASNPAEAARLQQEAEVFERGGQWSEAVDTYQRAANAAPDQAGPASRAAEAAAAWARRTENPVEAVARWETSAQAYERAAGLDPSRRDLYRDYAAQSLFNAASRALEAADRPLARQLLGRARGLATPGGTTEKAILSHWESLGG